MSYHLLNVETLDYFYCDEKEWIAAIDKAIENDWRPDGTFFDYLFDAEDQCSDTDDIMYYFFMLISANNEALTWDGNYIEKKNQIVLYEDSIYLAIALEGQGVSNDLINFIKKGSFRICS